MYWVTFLLVLPAVFGSPIVEMIQTGWTSQESQPTEVRDVNWSYYDRQNRYFDDWFGWIGESNKRRAPTVQQRLQALEKRQQALYELVRCESIGEGDCAPLRDAADVAFDGPPKKPGKGGNKQPAADESVENATNNTPSGKKTTTTVKPTTSATTTTTNASESPQQSTGSSTAPTTANNTSS